MTATPPPPPCPLQCPLLYPTSLPEGVALWGDLASTPCSSAVSLSSHPSFPSCTTWTPGHTSFAEGLACLGWSSSCSTGRRQIVPWHPPPPTPPLSPPPLLAACPQPAASAGGPTSLPKVVACLESFISYSTGRQQLVPLCPPPPLTPPRLSCLHGSCLRPLKIAPGSCLAENV